MHLLHLVLPLILFCYGNLIGQGSAQVSIPLEMYDNAGGHRTLYFGVDPTATDSIDFHLGEDDLPPFPPPGAFEARWILPKNNFSGELNSYIDYRFAEVFPYTDTIIHRLKYQVSTGADTLFFGWNFPPEVTALMQNLGNGTFVYVSMSGTGVYSFTNFEDFDRMKFTIFYNSIVTGIENKDINPLNFKLEQNYPNPFNPTTTINVSIPNGSTISLKVFDLLGNEISEITTGYYSAGTYTFIFDGRNIASGVYIYQLKYDGGFTSKKMALLK